MIANRLSCPYYVITERLPIEVTIGILSRMRTVIGIRLHALMFSAGRGVPVIGMSYDIKVDGFLKSIGSRTCIPLREVTADRLIPLIDACVSGEMEPEVRATAALLREREQENSRGASMLLAQVGQNGAR